MNPEPDKPGMRSTPLISIVIPAYNADRFLSATLESIRAQSLQEWECIVVDDGSADQTRAVAEKHAALDDRIRVINQENAGPAAARNHGLAEICRESKYVSFMDSDDLWVPDALRMLADELERFPDAVGAHGLADFIDENGRQVAQGFADVGRDRASYEVGGAVPDVSEPTTFRLLAWTNRVYPPGVMLARRSSYERAGPFDGSFLRFDDWDMIVRLSRFGDFRFINKVILFYRRHGANLSAKNAVVLTRALRMIQHKIFFSSENTKEQRRTLRKGWRGLQVCHARQKWMLAREKLAKGQYAEAGRVIAGIYLQVHRYVRGYPTRKGI